MSRWLFSRKHFPWTKRCPGLLFLSLPGVTLSLSLHLFSLQFHVSFSSSSAAFTAPFLPTQNPNFTFLRPDICSFVQPWIKMHADYQKHWKMSSFFVIEQMRNEKSDVPLTLNWSRGLEFLQMLCFPALFPLSERLKDGGWTKELRNVTLGFILKCCFPGGGEVSPDKKTGRTLVEPHSAKTRRWCSQRRFFVAFMFL